MEYKPLLHMYMNNQTYFNGTKCLTLDFMGSMWNGVLLRTKLRTLILFSCSSNCITTNGPLSWSFQFSIYIDNNLIKNKIQKCMHIHIHRHTHAKHTHMHTCVHTQHTCMRMHTHTTHTRAQHIHTCMHVHTHTHTTHTQHIKWSLFIAYNDGQWVVSIQTCEGF